MYWSSRTRVGRLRTIYCRPTETEWALVTKHVAIRTSGAAGATASIDLALVLKEYRRRDCPHDVCHYSQHITGSLSAPFGLAHVLVLHPQGRTPVRQRTRRRAAAINWVTSLSSRLGYRAGGLLLPRSAPRFLQIGDSRARDRLR